MAPLLAAHDSARLHARRAVRAHRRAARAARRARPRRRAAARARALPPRLRARRRQAGAAPSRRATPQIMQRLAELTTRFGQNVLADEVELPAGAARTKPISPACPTFVRAAARQAARERGLADGAVITLSRSHIVPFLTFSERRDLREQAWRAWTSRGEHAGASDNRARRRARSSRCATSRRACTATRATPTTRSADTMAGSQAAVTDAARAGLAAGARRAPQDERDGARRRWRSRAASAAPIEPWDWRFYAEKVRQVRYDLDEAEVKPYFPLERMVAGGVRLRRSACSACASSRAPDIARLPPRRTRLRGARRRRRADRPLPARQLRAPDQAQRRLDERVPRCSRGTAATAPRRCCRSSSTTTTSRRARPASRRCSASTTRARCSTSSATACTGCCRTSPTSGSRAPTCCAISSSCRRSCSSTGSRSPRC